MKINGKNGYFYRNYVLERWKDVNSHKKHASLCLFIHVVRHWNNENQWGKWLFL